MPELPTGTVTFLFTDVEGSTRLWEEQPDGMREALARHDEIVRNAIAAHQGHLVKMTGDGAHAAFVNAQDAIGAAVAAQRALSEEAWGEPGELRVRMGIHTGPVEARDGDYFGTAVNRAARLMSAANGGQIVVSLATEDLLRDVSAGDTVMVLVFLDIYAQALATTDRAEAAAMLHASVGELAPHMSNPISVTHRRNTDERLLTQLGTERFAELAVRGATLEYDDAVALTFAELDRAITNDNDH